MPVIIFLSGLQSIPEDVKEAAAIDGASRSQQFFNIELLSYYHLSVWCSSWQ